MDILNSHNENIARKTGYNGQCMTKSPGWDESGDAVGRDANPQVASERNDRTNPVNPRIRV